MVGEYPLGAIKAEKMYVNIRYRKIKYSKLAHRKTIGIYYFSKYGSLSTIQTILNWTCSNRSIATEYCYRVLVQSFD